MKKTIIYSRISSAYVLGGILIMLGADQLGIAMLSVICFVGAWGYNNLADQSKREWETILSNLYDGTGHD